MQRSCRQNGFSKFLTVFNQNQDLGPSNASRKASIISYIPLSTRCHNLRSAAIATDMSATTVRPVRCIKSHYSNVSAARQRNDMGYHDISGLP